MQTQTIMLWSVFSKVSCVLYLSLKSSDSSGSNIFIYFSLSLKKCLVLLRLSFFLTSHTVFCLLSVFANRYAKMPLGMHWTAGSSIRIVEKYFSLCLVRKLQAISVCHKHIVSSQRCYQVYPPGSLAPVTSFSLSYCSPMSLCLHDASVEYGCRKHTIHHFKRDALGYTV